jgi:Zn-dependent peptidase ImmA (M78 family)
LESLEERVGIKVLSFATEWSLSGASLFGRFGAGIFVNRAHAEPRRIFTLAHEYFHLLASDVQSRQTAMRATVCSAEPGQKPRADILADQFAAEFLMPRDAVEERLADSLGAARTPTGTHIIRLAVSFGVSTQAMLFRLGNLGRLAKSTPAELYSDPNLRQQDRDIRWDAEHPPVSPRRFEILAIAAYIAGRISRGKLAELLGVPLPDVEDRVAPFRAGETLSEKLRHVG